MQYVKGVNTKTGKTISKETFVSIDYLDLVEKFDCSGFVPMIFFVSDHYTNIKNIDPSKWKRMVNPVNMTLKIVPEEKQYKLLRTFDVILKKIDIEFESINSEFSISKLITLMRTISKTLSDLERDINLGGYIEKYIKDNVYMGDFSSAGTNPQDRESITYREDDARNLMVIAVYSKILLPVFGHLITHIKSLIKNADAYKNKLNNKLCFDIEDMRIKREVFVALILEDLLRDHFSATNDKLDDYISDYVLSQYDDMKILSRIEKDTNDAAAKEYTSGTFYRGTTTNNLMSFTKSNLLVKSFVNGDIDDRKRSNFMAFVHSSVYEAINKKLNKRNQYPIFKRIDPSKNPDKEVPQFEIDSVSSETSLDILGIVDSEVPKIVDSLILSLNVKELYERTLKFNLYNSVTPTYINHLTLCTFFGHDLGGGMGILYLNHHRFCELISAMQMYLLSIGAGELMQAITAKPRAIKKEPTRHDTIIANRYRTGKYKEALIKFSHVENLFRTSIDKFVEELTTTEFTACLADCIYEQVGIENKNGHGLIFTLSVINDILYLINLKD